MTRSLLTTMLVFLLAGNLEAQLVGSVDLASVTPDDGLYERVLGSVGTGSSGVPVAGGHDIDGDGHADSAFAAMQANPQNRTQAGVVFLIFGNGTVGGQLDTLDEPHPAILEIHGDQTNENAGSEIWMADITGDGLGDLIICRQNYSPTNRDGAGAVTILPGTSQLRTMATNGDLLDLRAPPMGLPVVDIHGATSLSRLCMWARAGDVTGDGIDDLAVGADCEVSNGESDSGAVYLFRGGGHLANSQTIDLAGFPGNAAGNIARIRPSPVPGGASTTFNFHFGATVQVADLDGNGTAEVVVAAALNRSGGTLGVSGESCRQGSGGSPQGTLFVIWDDNLLGDWVPAPDFAVLDGPGTHTLIDGGVDNDVFGEEILGGRDYDNDGNPDLFVGDLTADDWDGVSPGGSNAGVGHVIYDAAGLKDLSFDIDNPPPGFMMATFVGPASNAIAGDTALHGDFNGDGIDDLAFSSPHDSPLGRFRAGTLHILLGQNGPWPVLSQLEPTNRPSSGVSIFEIYGAEGAGFPGAGDTLAYSAADGDMNGDGRIDLIFNEMQGDGSVTADVGNLVVIDSAALFPEIIFLDSFEATE